MEQMSACAPTAMSNDHDLTARTASTIADTAANAAPLCTSRRVWSAERAFSYQSHNDSQGDSRETIDVHRDRSRSDTRHLTNQRLRVRAPRGDRVADPRRVLIAHTALTNLLGEHADNDAIEPR